VHIKNNRAKTGFSQHILETGRAYNKIEHCMNIIKIQNKGKLLNTLEKFHIYKGRKLGNLLNENCVEAFNPIYELLL
jgi:ferritin-like metal-binding protein YciE